jgi:ribosome-binding protein aMBF1 (putative translation factor)
MNEQPPPVSLGEALDYVRRDAPEVARNIDRPSLAYDLAHAVMSVRRRHGLTQAMLAERVSMSQQQIANIEGLKANLTLKTLERLCRSLGIELRFDLPEAS